MCRRMDRNEKKIAYRRIDVYAARSASVTRASRVAILSRAAFSLDRMTVSLPVCKRMTDLLPQAQGLQDQMVGRGLDVVLTASVAALFYLVFRVIARLERMERDLTKIVREMAIRPDREETPAREGPRAPSPR